MEYLCWLGLGLVISFVSQWVFWFTAHRQFVGGRGTRVAWWLFVWVPVGLYVAWGICI